MNSLTNKTIPEAASVNPLSQPIKLSSVLRFTLPTMVTMVVMSLYTVVDGAFVSHLAGTEALSAVNLMYPLVSIIVGLGTMFGSGMAALASIKLGEGKQREACQSFTYIALCSVAVAVVISCICLICLDPIIYASGSDLSLYHLCRDYALPLLFFFPASILQLLFMTLYVVDGKPHIGLYVTIAGGVANVALDYLFIAELGMGIKGAAVATGIGYSIPALYGIVYFSLNRKGSLYFTRPKFSWRTLWNAASNGSSEMVSNFSTSVTTYLFNIILMRLAGPDGVAAITILLYLDFILIAVSLGYSMGVAPLISYNYGCADHDKLNRLFRTSTVFCLSTGAAVTIATILFAGPLTSIFAKEGTAVYEMAVYGLRIYALSYLMKSYNIFSSAMFTAFGNGMVSALLSFLRTLVFLSGSLVGLSYLFGIDGIWPATPVAETMSLLLSMCFVIKYRNIYHYGKVSNSKG